MTRIEEMASAVKDRVIEELRGHTDELDSIQLEYLADRILAHALMPYVDEWVEMRLNGEAFASGRH